MISGNFYYDSSLTGEAMEKQKKQLKEWMKFEQEMWEETKEWQDEHGECYDEA